MFLEDGNMFLVNGKMFLVISYKCKYKCKYNVNKSHISCGFLNYAWCIFKATPVRNIKC